MSYFPQLQHPQPVFPTDIINGDDDRPPPYSSPAPPEMGYASFPDVGPSVPRVTVPTSHPAHHADPRFPQKESFLDSRPSFSTPSPSSPPNQFIPDSQRPSAAVVRLAITTRSTIKTTQTPPAHHSRRYRHIHHRGLGCRCSRCCG
ncbi:hypothetical protein JAAARDRAFT_631801 [Jaapia argillacea MUCL 33604]|uniref:Uncharacterized protein n=1 Tax=Jaapia argillacea MUCL 33604 TaxID=933084 RepID=A0A067QAZ7_9AGAM|nr:hypothetical protein JAAARDRAFT_631801 [Jaapia argillacea MUCL 33604]